MRDILQESLLKGLKKPSERTLALLARQAIAVTLPYEVNVLSESRLTVPDIQEVLLVSDESRESEASLKGKRKHHLKEDGHFHHHFSKK